MISACVPYFNNESGLAITLMMLQQQTVLPDQIIIMDSSKDRSGLALAKRYRLPGAKITVEIHRGNIYEAWNKGIELAGLSDCLILNDDLLFPLDMVEILDYMRTRIPAMAYVPETPTRGFRSDKVEQPFLWLSDTSGVEATEWMPGFCYFLPRKTIKTVGVFDPKFDVWYGDTDYENRLKEHGTIAKINGLYVYHYGSSSYSKLDRKKLQKRIDKDGLYFNKKWKKELV